MSMLSKLTDRMLALLGLDFDLSVALNRDPFNAITDDLYLGKRPSPEQALRLKDEGITHIVSCVPEEARDRVSFLQDEFDSLFLPVHDGMHEDLASVFPTFFDFVRAAYAHRRDAKVFVHCEVGVSRSAALVTALVMRRERKRFYDAYRDVRAKRAEVLPNIGFASHLQQLEFDMFPRAAGETSSLARYLKEVCLVPVDLDTLQDVLDRNQYDAVSALQAIFGEEIPRVVQGVRR